MSPLKSKSLVFLSMAFDLHLGCCQAAEAESAESAGRLMSNLEDLVTRPDSACYGANWIDRWWLDASLLPSQPKL